MLFSTFPKKCLHESESKTSQVAEVPGSSTGIIVTAICTSGLAPAHPPLVNPSSLHSIFPGSILLSLIPFLLSPYPTFFHFITPFLLQMPVLPFLFFLCLLFIYCPPSPLDICTSGQRLKAHDLVYQDCKRSAIAHYDACGPQIRCIERRWTPRHSLQPPNAHNKPTTYS